jgi:hypothetical protein
MMALLNSKMPPGASWNWLGNFFGSGSSPTHTRELLAFQAAASFPPKPLLPII